MNENKEFKQVKNVVKKQAMEREKKGKSLTPVQSRVLKKSK